MSSKIKLNPFAVERSKFETRISELETWKSGMSEQDEEERKFNIGMLLSLNGLANALIANNVVTMHELERGRQEALKEYFEQMKARQTSTPEVVEKAEKDEIPKDE